LFARIVNKYTGGQMTAATRTRTTARNRAADEARTRIVDRLRSQFPELGESEIQAAVGSPERDLDDARVASPLGGAEPAGRGARMAEPRRHRA
jgi:hypothetical protein